MLLRERIAFVLPKLRFDIGHLHNQLGMQAVRCAVCEPSTSVTTLVPDARPCSYRPDLTRN